MAVGQEVTRGQGCGQDVVRGFGSSQNFRNILLMFIMLIICFNAKFFLLMHTNDSQNFNFEMFFNLSG